MTGPRSQGEIGIERMCQLAGISRSGYYRHWQLSAPRQEETGLRDVIQRLALRHRHYGYRRIGALLRREGWQANHKRVLRLMREDNLLCLRHTPFGCTPALELRSPPAREKRRRDVARSAARWSGQESSRHERIRHRGP